MNGYVFDRPCTEPNVVLSKAAIALGDLGYELTSTEETCIKAKRAGKWITANPAKMRHFLELTATGEQVRFRFHTGLVASSWGDDDKSWAEGQADKILAAD